MDKADTFYMDKLRESLTEILGGPQQLELFDQASEHPYNCRCELCLQWWIEVGPESEDDDTWGFGPFTKEEYLAAGGKIPSVTPGELFHG